MHVVFNPSPSVAHKYRVTLPNKRSIDFGSVGGSQAIKMDFIASRVSYSFIFKFLLMIVHNNDQQPFYSTLRDISGRWVR